jgi:hypothetical protein
MPAWLNARWFKDREVKARSLNYKSGDNVLKQTLHQSLSETNLPALLRYEDRNSMAFSIESRVPFLTPALVNFVLALPEDYIISTDGTTKAIFRQAMRGIVPDVILDRNDKIGFAAPDKQWLLTLRAPVERLLASETAMQISAINLKEIQSQWSGVVAGRNPFNLRVWRWINLILWVQKFAVNVPETVRFGRQIDRFPMKVACSRRRDAPILPWCRSRRRTSSGVAEVFGAGPSNVTMWRADRVHRPMAFGARDAERANESALSSLVNKKMRSLALSLKSE